MTVTVMLPDGEMDEYSRFGDAFVKRHDGSLDVVRRGEKKPRRYESGQWIDVAGTEKHWKKPRLWG
ncbi:hypothetical protein [Mycolicibacterium sphagni]|uniref:Uncharacterized protein n=1 Tax=Mycolicibacterium sphagni TaxID=1786 RepID=A0ABX2JM06_9MYCO|nr:hypothetical protein [Mycolicibacterium sphagni]NTY58716.1 hypothetical protein [Mycolicibacterium sphagni]